MAQDRSWDAPASSNSINRKENESLPHRTSTGHGRGRGRRVDGISSSPKQLKTYTQESEARGVYSPGADKDTTPKVPRGRGRWKQRRPDQAIYIPGAMRRERLKENAEVNPVRNQEKKPARHSTECKGGVEQCVLTLEEVSNTPSEAFTGVSNRCVKRKAAHNQGGELVKTDNETKEPLLSTVYKEDTFPEVKKGEVHLTSEELSNKYKDNQESELVKNDDPTKRLSSMTYKVDTVPEVEKDEVHLTYVNISDNKDNQESELVKNDNLTERLSSITHKEDTVPEVETGEPELVISEEMSDHKDATPGDGLRDIESELVKTEKLTKELPSTTFKEDTFPEVKKGEMELVTSEGISDHKDAIPENRQTDVEMEHISVKESTDGASGCEANGTSASEAVSSFFGAITSTDSLKADVTTNENLKDFITQPTGAASDASERIVPLDNSVLPDNNKDMIDLDNCTKLEDNKIEEKRDLDSGTCTQLQNCDATMDNATSTEDKDPDYSSTDAKYHSDSLDIKGPGITSGESLCEKTKKVIIRTEEITDLIRPSGIKDESQTTMDQESKISVSSDKVAEEDLRGNDVQTSYEKKEKKKKKKADKEGKKERKPKDEKDRKSKKDKSKEKRSEKDKSSRHRKDKEQKGGSTGDERDTLTSKTDAAARVKVAKDHKNGGEGGGSGDDWEMNFDESGDCINPELLEELSDLTGISKPSVHKTQFDFYSFKPKEVNLDEDPAYAHIVEIYDFSPDLKTTDIAQALASFAKQGYDIKWVDDTHALGVFSSEITAKQAIQFCSSPLLKLRPVCDGIPESKSKARGCLEFLMPYKPRPQTTNLTAHRLVAGALGKKSAMTKEQRHKEREKIKEAREQRRQEKQRKADVWGDDT